MAPKKWLARSILTRWYFFVKGAVCFRVEKKGYLVTNDIKKQDLLEIRWSSQDSNLIQFVYCKGWWDRSQGKHISKCFESYVNHNWSGGPSVESSHQCRLHLNRWAKDPQKIQPFWDMTLDRLQQKPGSVKVGRNVFIVVPHKKLPLRVSPFCEWPRCNIWSSVANLCNYILCIMGLFRDCSDQRRCLTQAHLHHAHASTIYNASRLSNLPLYSRNCVPLWD